MEKPLKPMILNSLRGFLLLQTVKVGKNSPELPGAKDAKAFRRGKISWRL